MTHAAHAALASPEILQGLLEAGAGAAQEAPTCPAVMLPDHEGELDPALLAGVGGSVRDPDWPDQAEGHFTSAPLVHFAAVGSVFQSIKVTLVMNMKHFVVCATCIMFLIPSLSLFIFLLKVSCWIQESCCTVFVYRETPHCTAVHAVNFEQVEAA